MHKLPESSLELRVLLRGLPANSGVYKFLDKVKKPIYIGKAKNLRKRVPSYFQETANKPKKIESLIRLSKYIDITLTNNELEALLLEQYLIKESKPQFNVQFKDDKGYPWIKLEVSKDFPAAKSYLGKKKDSEKYFGPFPSSYAVRDALSLIQKTFKLRNCNDSFFKNRSRPCMQYQIGRCSGPCVGHISKQDYSEEVIATKLLLEGKSEQLLSGFYDQMDKLSKRKLYEKAAVYRDKISSLRDVQRQQSAAGFLKERDAICISVLDGFTRVGITHVREGWVTGHENFIQNNISLESSLVSSFIISHYLSSDTCPKTLVFGEIIEDKSILEEALSVRHSKKVRIITKPGNKDKGLLEICSLNTNLASKRDNKNFKDLSNSFLSLKKFLNINEDIDVIESYDASHHSSSGAVMGCVAYTKLGKFKERYRLFNISKKNAGNDIGSMEETMERRFRSKTSISNPDLLIIDGGRTHLDHVVRKLKSLKIEGVKVISISKGARRKSNMDTIHKMDGSKYAVDGRSSAHLLVQEIRDETHRFAITNQKNKISKISMGSSLEEVHGIGDKRKKILLRYFGSAAQIKRAGIHDFMNIPGFGKRMSESIYNQLH